MRPNIQSLDADRMPWQPTPAPGLFTKTLSEDPETGAHTSIYWLSPSHGYQPPTCAHFHHTYEEILPLSGSFSFDSRLWMEPGGYVFHPPMTVHGFQSAIREESVFFSRIGRTLDFNYVPEPKARELYLLDGSAPGRLPVAHGDARGAIGWHATTFLGAAVEACLLSSDGAEGEGSALVRVPAGWASVAQASPTALELLVVEGTLAMDEAIVPTHGYFFLRPGAGVAPLVADAPATLFVAFGSAIGL